MGGGGISKQEFFNLTLYQLNQLIKDPSGKDPDLKEATSGSFAAAIAEARKQYEEMNNGT